MPWDNDKRAVKSANLSKAERIKFLQDSGLNTLVYETFNFSMPKAIEDFARIVKRGAPVSIRCEPSSNAIAPSLSLASIDAFIEKDADGKVRLPPHFPYIEGVSNVEYIIKKLIELGWSPLIADGMSFNDNLLSGTIMAIKGRQWPTVYDFLLEAVIGPNVSVRDITHGREMDISLRLPHALIGIQQGALYEIWEQVKSLRKMPIYIEFGYSKRPVGWKKTRPIFWECHFIDESVYDLDMVELR